MTLPANRLITLFVLLVVGTIFSLGCGSDSANHNDNTSAADTTAPVGLDDEMLDEDDDMGFYLPSPLQIAAIFKKSGLSYANGMTNSPDNVHRYASKTSKSLNFGGYSADLSYCVLNNHPQEALKYMKCLKDMSNDLGISSIFSTTELFQSFEHNLDNEDSLLYILATIQEELDEHLDNSDQEYMTTIFFAGAWVEGMYLGSRLHEGGDQHDRLAKKLLEQMSILENLVKALDKYPNPDEELNWLKGELEALDAQCNEIEAIKMVRENEDEMDYSSMKFSPEELKNLTDRIVEIRTRVVNG